MPIERIYEKTGKIPADEIHHVDVQWFRQLAQVGVGSFEDNPDAKSDDELRGIMVWLSDRHSVNRLIRTLRKARDQSFGEDA